MPRTLPQLIRPSSVSPAPPATLQEVARAFGHDLREQLSLMSLNGQLLRHRCGSQLSAEALRLLDQTAAAVSRTERLTADLIALLRLREGPHEPAGPVRTALALKRALESLTHAIERSGGVVTCGELPDVQASERHVQEIFERLLDNALKFRGEAPPRVSVSGQSRGGMALFRVSDNGIGIDERYAPQAFLPLKRLNGHTYEGTGMGLAFCRALVELYGCGMAVESRPGEGSTFLFELPLAREAA